MLFVPHTEDRQGSSLNFHFPKTLQYRGWLTNLKNIYSSTFCNSEGKSEQPLVIDWLPGQFCCSFYNLC